MGQGTWAAGGGGGGRVLEGCLPPFIGVVLRQPATGVPSPWKGPPMALGLLLLAPPPIDGQAMVPPMPPNPRVPPQPMAPAPRGPATLLPMTLPPWPMEVLPIMPWVPAPMAAEVAWLLQLGGPSRWLPMAPAVWLPVARPALACGPLPMGPLPMGLPLTWPLPSGPLPTALPTTGGPSMPVPMGPPPRAAAPGPALEQLAPWPGNGAALQWEPCVPPGAPSGGSGGGV
mmetsp:Transcript_5351/g.14889  ORF Transcript_5351/g.14889 Transcript_5351/m.14889 type:complete len:229 (+) Transcript_5351:158-844(+)